MARDRSGWWWVGVAVVSLAGLAVRIATVLGRPNRKAGGDEFTYHNGANLLASGHGFIDPWLYYTPHHHIIKQSASFPPLFLLLLAAVSLIGFKSFFAQRIFCCILGAAAIPLFALTGREIDSKKVGMVAAVIAALYPNLWMNDELALSEALTPLLVVLLLYSVYHFWRRPSWWRAGAMGAALGVAILGRDELSLLALLVVVPMTLLARQVGFRRRVAMLGVTAAVAVLLIGPWVGYNFSRFEKPVFISTGLGVTLASANCNVSYYGPLTGYWSYRCALATPINRKTDESVWEIEARHWALKYVDAHRSRLPALALARVGRAFGFFQPYQQIALDADVETRPYTWAKIGLWSYWAMLPLAAVGTVVLRRRRVPVFPLWAVAVQVAVAVVITFGQTRYRIPFEVSLVLLASVPFGLIGRRRPPPPAEVAAAADTPGDADAAVVDLAGV